MLIIMRVDEVHTCITCDVTTGRPVPDDVTSAAGAVHDVR